jgi:hypothetical protein|tara:strand:+ start:146 stop:544 length:399 start_codon:yes stop_codon:yes gene_type:complete
MEKYLYFRTQATIGDDDAGSDSACWPLSSFLGMHPTADDTLVLHFKPQIAAASDAQDGNFINTDKVVLTLGTANTHKAAMQALIKAFRAEKGFNGDGDDSFIVVADDISTGTKYLVSQVSAVSTIAIQGAMS